MLPVPFVCGIVLCVGAVLLLGLAWIQLMRVVELTRGRDDGLTEHEATCRSAQLRRLVKLLKLSERDTDPRLRRCANYAVALESTAILLFMSGMVLVFVVTQVN